MEREPEQAPPPRPAPLAIALAFTAIYLTWGTTYLAIRIGVAEENLPPALFGGTRILLAGLILFGALRLRGAVVELTRREWIWTTLSALLMFVGGNGLITAAEKTVESGRASILVATTPLWLALLENLWPHGERLRPRGWFGLALGLSGVLLLKPNKLEGNLGTTLVICSALCWALGSLLIRYHRPRGSQLVAAALQMIVGGACLSLVGLALGEQHELPEQVTWNAAGSFVYLLIFGSLVGFVAFHWLMGHVPATLVGTYAYVNPLIAVLVGWLWAAEPITGKMLVGMIVILGAVALVRGASRRRETPSSTVPQRSTCPEPEEANEKMMP